LKYLSFKTTSQAPTLDERRFKRRRDVKLVCPFKGRFLMVISSRNSARSCQAIKEKPPEGG